MEQYSRAVRVSPFTLHVGILCLAVGALIGYVAHPREARAQSVSWFERSVVEELKEISSSLKGIERKMK
jgi:hypothetical protein